MDRFGNAVSQTQTVRDWFGCGIVVGGYGFVLNNAMRDAAKLSVGALRRSMQVLDDLDRALKSTAVDAKILLEEAIVKLSVIAVSG